MNWNVLKQKYPCSFYEIMGFYRNSVNKDNRTVLMYFLKSKGFDVGLTFIDCLEAYERKKRTYMDFKNEYAIRNGFNDYEKYLESLPLKVRIYKDSLLEEIKDFKEK